MNRERRRRRRRDESGQTLIELMLVLPLLLLVLFGLLEFANAWRTYQVITNSAREGVRHAIVPSSTLPSVEQRTHDRLREGGLDPDKPGAGFTFGICTAGVDCSIGDPDTVAIAYPYQFRMLGPLVGLICGSCGTTFGSITLEAVAVMRNE